MQKKILIFDDDMLTLEICAIICEGLGLEVRKSETTFDVIDQVRSVNPDIILMDNRIPGFGGIKSIELLKNSVEFKDIPIVFFSAGISQRDKSEKFLADYILPKPFDVVDLEGALNRLLA